jgi:hypothetical protein
MVEVQELSDWVGVICLLGLQELYAGDVHIEICLTGI